MLKLGLILVAWLVYDVNNRRNVASFSTGAPDLACDTMEPGHYFSPQTSSPPVRLSVDATEILPAGKVLVTLESDRSFKGYLIQARESSRREKGDSQVGSFQTLESNEFSNYLTCFSGIHNTLTHREPTLKSKVEAEWNAPADFVGEIVFRYSFVMEYDQYWVRLDSQPVTVVIKSKVEDSTIIDFPQNTTKSYSTASKFQTLSSVGMTSTSSTTTTTHAPIGAAAKFLPPNHDIFTGCGNSKTCFGFNNNLENCIGGGNCIGVVSYELKGSKLLFKMAGKTNGYLSVGLSYDDRMGDDLTVSCYYNSMNGEIGVQAGFNVGKSNKILTPSKLAIEDFQGQYEDGFLNCEFKRPLQIAILQNGNKTFDLAKEEFIILLSEGEFGSQGMVYHNMKIKSSKPQALGIATNLQGASKLFIKLHGSFMIGAWIFAASCGMLLARYYKQTWANSKCCKIDYWFMWHRNFMVTTWSLTMTGFAFIFLELNGWTEIPIDQNPHALLGCITSGLCFMQPIIAMLRCAPTNKRRPIFNWVHWFVGNAAQIVGITAIFFAQELKKAELPNETDYILIAFLAFHLLMHLILSLNQCLSCMKKEHDYTSYPLRNLNGNKIGQSGLYPDYEEEKSEAPGSGMRKLFLAIYLLVSATAASVLISLVILGKNVFKK